MLTIVLKIKSYANVRQLCELAEVFADNNVPNMCNMTFTDWGTIEMEQVIPEDVLDTIEEFCKANHWVLLCNTRNGD